MSTLTRFAAFVTTPLIALALPVPLSAQSPSSPANAPFAILDNSFLVEEAFNQEPGVVQNIFGFVHTGTEWETSFTQEWPVASRAHQFSYTLVFDRVDGARGIGDVLINYRYQLWSEGPRRPAFAPRVSVILPSGDHAKGLGDGVTGLQVNLPFSKQRGAFYWHWNAGVTYLPGASTSDDTTRGNDVTLVTPRVAASTIWQVRPMLNVMLEETLEFQESVSGPSAVSRHVEFVLSPGVRGGWNIGDQQIILGAAVPIIVADRQAHCGGVAYFSYELPFR
jgi:hypothetical protein